MSLEGLDGREPRAIRPTLMDSFRILAVVQQPARSLQCDQQQLGNMYAVLSKRRGRVVDEDLVDGTQVSFFAVSSVATKNVCLAVIVLLCMNSFCVHAGTFFFILYGFRLGLMFSIESGS